MTEALRAQIMAEKPTTEQENAIFAVEQEFLLRASPGSGKTWTSCRRFLWRCANWQYANGGMAFLSFTNVAVREFKTAVGKAGHGATLGEPHFVGTVDVFMERFILGPFGHVLSKARKRPKLFAGPKQADEKNNQLMVWDNGTSPAIPVQAWDIIPVYSQTGVTFARQVLGNRKTLSGNARPAVQGLLETGRYTHEQRGFWAWELMAKYPELARALAGRFPEILVDEAQDCGSWILLILGELRKHGTKITLVGDPDQCIYEFAQADPEQLKRLKLEWGLQEKPLQKSFRCNDAIAGAVRPFGTNPGFTGNGTSGPKRTAFYVSDSNDDFAESVAAFRELLVAAGLPEDGAAVLSRGKEQLVKLRGIANYTKLKGKTYDLAMAVNARDHQANPLVAMEVVRALIREASADEVFWDEADDKPDSERAQAVRLALWQFVRNPERLPPLSRPATEWFSNVRAKLTELEKEIGLPGTIKFGSIIRSTGLDDVDKAAPLLSLGVTDSKTLRYELIHQVKGETIPAVLAIGAQEFWSGAVNAVASSSASEKRRLAFVAMTRAEHLLVIGLPAKHASTHGPKWASWGFQPYSSTPKNAQGVLF